MFGSDRSRVAVDHRVQWREPFEQLFAETFDNSGRVGHLRRARVRRPCQVLLSRGQREFRGVIRAPAHRRTAAAAPMALSRGGVGGLVRRRLWERESCARLC